MNENKVSGIVLFGDTSQKPNIVKSNQNRDSKISPNVLYSIDLLKKVYTKGCDSKTD